VEIGAETLTHPSRKAIIQRCGKAAHEIHAGLTSAVTITGLTEEHS
jgi:hypothetical protein